MIQSATHNNSLNNKLFLPDNKSSPNLILQLRSELKQWKLNSRTLEHKHKYDINQLKAQHNKEIKALHYNNQLILQEKQEIIERLNKNANNRMMSKESELKNFPSGSAEMHSTNNQYYEGVINSLQSAHALKEQTYLSDLQRRSNEIIELKLSAESLTAEKEQQIKDFHVEFAYIYSYLTKLTQLLNDLDKEHKTQLGVTTLFWQEEGRSLVNSIDWNRINNLKSRMIHIEKLLHRINTKQYNTNTPQRFISKTILPANISSEDEEIPEHSATASPPSSKQLPCPCSQCLQCVARISHYKSIAEKQTRRASEVKLDFNSQLLLMKQLSEKQAARPHSAYPPSTHRNNKDWSAVFVTSSPQLNKAKLFRPTTAGAGGRADPLSNNHSPSAPPSNRPQSAHHTKLLH
jgi:hypothetical protein